MRRGVRQNPFRRKVWNFPAFSPERLREYVVREVCVTHWVRLDRFLITLNVTASLYNERMSGFSLAKRLRVGFEETPRPFFVREATVYESTVTLCVAGAPGHLERFKRSATLCLQSVRNPDSKIKISRYAFSVLGEPKPDRDPDDIPF